MTLQVPSLQQQTRVELKTDFYSAKSFANGLTTKLERAEQFERPLTVVRADVDRLRTIDNTYDYLAGDRVRTGIANSLRQSVHGYDMVARFGGEAYTIGIAGLSLC